jgi:aryl-alcohol dehydrogenase-like predicted oxidoreductase
MEYRYLGKSGLKVSEICFGVMTFTGTQGWRHVGNTVQSQANKLVDIALEKGVNFFDTADVYSNGASEKILGKALDKNRHKAVIGTKFGFRMADDPNGDGLSRARIVKACEDSLKRLNTDYIDLYQIHSDDFTTPIEETLSALDILVKQGKVRYIGCSNYTAWQLVKAMYEAEKKNLEKFISLQAYYTILGRDLELEILPACIDQGIGVTVWGPLHGGILTGKYHKTNKWPKGTRIKTDDFIRPHDKEVENKVLDLLFKIARNRGVTVTQISLNYLLRKKGISSVIIGARNKKQLLENIDAASFKLSNEEIQKIDAISMPYQTYPHWYFKIYRKDNYEKNYLI